MDSRRCKTTVIPFVHDLFPIVFQRFLGNISTVANDNGASFRSSDHADAAGQTLGMAFYQVLPHVGLELVYDFVDTRNVSIEYAFDFKDGRNARVLRVLGCVG